MTRNQKIALIAVSAVAFVAIMAVGTYPKWGMIIRQSGNRQ